MTEPNSPKLDYQPQKPTRSWRDDISAEWARFASGFTRDNIIGHLKTLAWVVPLTLLIWIYAEREQVATTKDVSVPFKFITPGDRVVTVKSPQDMNLVLELQGPQARLQEVLEELRGGKGSPRGLDIELPSLEVNAEHRPNALELVRDNKTFVSNGVTVVSVQPARLSIVVDEVVERDARILRPPGAKNLEATFDPPTVKVRGPLSVLNRAAQSDPAGQGRLVVYAEIPEDVMRTPGPHNVPNVALVRPEPLQDETVTIATPSKISANVEVREADKSLVITSMTVTLDTPAGLLEKYAVNYRPVLQNVTVTGPPDIIDAMAKPDFEPKPKARVLITQQDVGEPKSKVVQYDLPDEVEVSDEDKKREVEVHVVDRSTLPPS